jgi:pyruvate-formate lyase
MAATNELTYLLLEAAPETGLPHHTLTLRVHPDTPEKLMIKALEVVRTGIGGAVQDEVIARTELSLAEM